MNNPTTNISDSLNEITMHPFVSKLRQTSHPLARLRRSLKQAAAEVRNGKPTGSANKNVSTRVRLQEALKLELPSDLRQLIERQLKAE